MCWHFQVASAGQQACTQHQNDDTAMASITITATAILCTSMTTVLTMTTMNTSTSSDSRLSEHYSKYKGNVFS
jgi:hypothetical protein